MNTLVAVPTSHPSGSLAPLAVSARDYVRHAKAASTLRAYRSDWFDFEAWAKRSGLVCLPANPEVVALYITSLADQGKKVATGCCTNTSWNGHRVLRVAILAADDLDLQNLFRP